MTKIFTRYYDTLLAPFEKAGIKAYRKRLIQQVRGNGCHLNRDTLTLAQEAGFTILRMEHHMKAMVIFGSLSRNPREKPDIQERQ